MPPNLGAESLDMSNTAKSLNCPEEFHTRKAAGVGGYAFQIIFQVIIFLLKLAETALLCQNPKDLHLLYAINLTSLVFIWVTLHIISIIFLLHTENTKWVTWRFLLRFIFIDICRCCSTYRLSILVHSLSTFSSKSWARFCKYLFTMFILEWERFLLFCLIDVFMYSLFGHSLLSPCTR